MAGQFWRRVGRFILWDYPRGGWQYDLMVGLILAFIFFTPRDFFRDQPRPATIMLLEGHEGSDVLWLAPNLLQGVPEAGRRAQATVLIEGKLRRKIELVRLDPLLDAESEITGYMALVKP